MCVPRYAVQLGYWKDDFVSLFMKSAERRAPEINRGTCTPMPRLYLSARCSCMLSHSHIAISMQCVPLCVY